ncbi:hypothetical protein J5N97_026134 [Dioscorea zingiberensis]|uniref:RING/U-box protein n=1 Tax=Dioscorea zingiberensis TaxID=325984 RepID=A0A9D5H6F0_9LILI|nr:hypothetical protein J5N97_026134 [Dioscorea zingiberensis]
MLVSKDDIATSWVGKEQLFEALDIEGLLDREEVGGLELATIRFRTLGLVVPSAEDSVLGASESGEAQGQEVFELRSAQRGGFGAPIGTAFHLSPDSVNWSGSVLFLEIMDLSLYANSESEEATIEDEADIDDAAFENLKCGICMDVVIDRGVLDCCQHWFCFPCIDNWATITNLCPFCKNEFQLITCLPVYDTLGTINSEEHSFSRDDEWLIQGKTNTLSFPSYYINEEAIICLDGDGCKIRSGLSSSEDELNVDTSIACDSCDIWYHAFCVGFNSPCTSDRSWLCPRCVSDQGAQRSDAFLKQNVVNHSESVSADPGWSIDSTLSGKVSVSVADTGDTDVVVSMVEAKPKAVTTESLPSADCLDFSKDREIGINMTNIADGTYNVEIGLQADKRGFNELVPFSANFIDKTMPDAIAPDVHNNSEIVLNFSHKAAIGSADYLKDNFSIVPSMHDASLDMKPIDHQMETPLVFPVSQSPSSSYFDPAIYGYLGPEIMEEKFKLETVDSSKIPDSCSIETEDDPSFNTSVRNAHPDPSVASSTSVDLAKDKITVAIGAGENADGFMPKGNFEDGNLVGEHMMKPLPDIIDGDFLSGPDRKREREIDGKMETEHPMKKTRSEGECQLVLLENEVHNSAMNFTKRDLSPATVSEDDDILKHSQGKDGKALDIMSLVQENKHKSNNVSVCTDSADRLLEKRDGAVGLRVKKIMRSVGDSKESSILIQKLRTEIREAVQDKTSDIIDKVKILNGDLLTAFRAALARPKNEVVDKSEPSHSVTRKPFLLKGKTRENLTKKIYQTSTGRRKKAWDRDCEVEFWKHRCRRTKTEKVETLQSVLELLKRASSSCLENSEIDQDSHKQTTDSILSRVYLADASVFPRKDDIMPLSVLEGYQVMGSHGKNREKNVGNVPGKDSQLVFVTNMTNNPVGNSECHPHGKTPSTNNEKKLSSLNSKKEVPCQKGNSNGARAGPTSIAGASSSKESTLNSNEAFNNSCLAKTDKKKWALEVLARKNALTNADASNGNQEDRPQLKGNYPLLAQLPADMMPTLASSHSNKVSLSVRQAQLHRIAEHYLRRANLSSMRRTAVTELAIADAVNVEKDIFERSNSKLVYVNLCSQALSHHKIKAQTSENVVCAPIATSSHDTDTDFRVEVTSRSSVVATGNKVEEALKLAGLYDTPPNSPCRPGGNNEEDDAGLVNVREKDLADLLAMNSHPHSNVFRDSVHNLDDEGYTLPSRTMDATSMHPEDMDSRINSVPSVNCEKSDSKFVAQNSLSSEQESITTYQHDFKVVEVSSDLSTMSSCQSDTQLEVRVPLVQVPSQVEEFETNRGLLESKLSDEVIVDPSNNLEIDAAGQHPIHREIEKPANGDKDLLVVEICSGNNLGESSIPPGCDHSPSQSLISVKAPMDGMTMVNSNVDSAKSISRKVEAYIKEHIRPLCKSGVITVEQYRWAVAKTTEKVMKFHYKAKNANFLIKEGPKVKKLSEDYVEAAQHKEWA